MTTLPAAGRRGAWTALGTAILVGSVAFTLIKISLETLSPLTLAAGRVVFSALAFGLVVSLQPWRRTPVAREDRWLLVGCGFAGSAGFHVLYSWGQERVSVTVGVVVLGCMPVVAAALEAAFLEHRLSPVQGAGLLLSVAGVVATSLGSGGGGDGPRSSWTGVLAVVGATVVWAGLSVATRSLADRYDPWWLNTPGTLLGAAVMVVLVLAAGSWPELGALTPSGWAMVVWLGMVSSAFIYAAFARAMQHLPATTVASVSTVVTPLGVLAAWVALGERPGPVTVLGGVAVVVGAVLVTRPARRPVPEVVP